MKYIQIVWVFCNGDTLKPNVTAVTLYHSAVIAFWHLAYAVSGMSIIMFHLTDRDFLASNLREWSNSLLFKTCQQMLPHLALVKSQLSITSSHVVRTCIIIAMAMLVPILLMEHVIYNIA